ncbi:proteasome assembly chaperone 1-like [Amphiura filiformis]|uniref:proteasome assembly chaperone 1-like n=1 Tax=Amphiura filiformis TaxID=82378 RepID=UPI003B21DCB3
MATFFGEVLTFSSRAVDDDDDDDEDQSQPWIPSPELEWSEGINEEINKSPNKLLKCSNLIVTVGAAAAGFVEAYILQNEAAKIGDITAGKIDSEGSTARHQAHSNRESALFRLRTHPGVIVCQCKQEILAEQVFQWTEKIFSQLDTTSIEVLVLDSCPVQSYKAAVSISEIQTPFLRCLRSSPAHSQSQPSRVPFLESPNTVKGLSAAVLTHCQVSNLPASLYVAFLESMFIDLDSFKVFTPLLQSTVLSNITKANKTADNILKKILDERTLKDSLYI